MKLITFVIPCYNSSEYMDHCIESILVCGDDIEVLIVDDGSTKDDTAAKADDWQERYPGIIRAIHQENGGHGAAVNTGIANATGLYLKVVDSDDWLDEDAAHEMMKVLRGFSGGVDGTIDMLICNFVYEHVLDNTHHTMSYNLVFPKDRVFGWGEIGHFPDSTYLLMHSIIYRTDVLRRCKLELPKHTFYVDNIFVYVPLPYVMRMYYLNVDLYRYFIGREDQSVNESVMISRIDQQLLVTRVMIDSVKIPEDTPIKKLEDYMVSYLTMMMTISSIFSLMSDRPDKLELKDGIWRYLENRDPVLYDRIRHSFMGVGTNLPGKFGRKAVLAGYRGAQKIFKFN